MKLSMVDGCNRLGESQRDCGGSGLYVDMENLRGDGQAVIEGLVRNWPGNAPVLSRLSLYVRADQVELWRLWATSRFEDMEVVVKGTQHFSMSPTKNSSDISIAVNAMADLLLKRVSHIAVLSDDSDFISLYAAICDEPEISSNGSAPFLWVVTDRDDTLSATVKQFFPPCEAARGIHWGHSWRSLGEVCAQGICKANLGRDCHGSRRGHPTGTVQEHGL